MANVSPFLLIFGGGRRVLVLGNGAGFSGSSDTEVGREIGRIDDHILAGENQIATLADSTINRLGRMGLPALLPELVAYRARASPEIGRLSDAGKTYDGLFNGHGTDWFEGLRTGSEQRCSTRWEMSSKSRLPEGPRRCRR